MISIDATEYLEKYYAMGAKIFFYEWDDWLHALHGTPSNKGYIVSGSRDHRRKAFEMLRKAAISYNARDQYLQLATGHAVRILSDDPEQLRGLSSDHMILLAL